MKFVRVVECIKETRILMDLYPIIYATVFLSGVITGECRNGYSILSAGIHTTMVKQ